MNFKLKYLGIHFINSNILHNARKIEISKNENRETGGY